MPQQSSQPATRRTARQRYLSMTQDGLLVVTAAVFCWAQASNAIEQRSLTNAGLAFEQLLLVGMFLTRRRSRATSTRPWDWVVATGGWLSLLLRPADAPSEWAAIMGTAIQLFGLTFTCVAFVYLGRSFGVVAANRGLKVSGPYRFVRHPIYLSHTITATGYLVANASPWNALILVTLTACQVLRIRAEERLLTETDDYSAYRDHVRWRLVPGLY